MSALYLSEVMLSDFRTYGPESKINLTPGPGLTVLCGMNGLGKTGFFDGVEWALTGDVRRLRTRGVDNIEKCLGRIGRSAPYAVELTFNSGAKLGRRESTPQDSLEVIGLLKDPQWIPPIQSVATYLRLTHLLAQSGQQRFVDAGPDRQWELLKGAAGVDRIDQLRNLLSTVKAGNAFRREIARLQVEHDDMASKLGSLRSLQKRKGELSSLASANSAISPEVCRLEAEKILGDLPQISNELELVIQDPSVAEFLGRLAKAIERWDGTIKLQQDQFSSQQDMVARWQTLERKEEARKPQKEIISERLAKMEKEEATALEELAQARKNLTRLEDETKTHERIAEAIEANREATGKIDALTVRETTTITELSAAKDCLEKAEANLSAARKSRAKRDELAAQNLEIQKGEKSLEMLEALLAQVAALKQPAEAAVLEKSALEKELPGIKASIGVFQLELVAVKNVASSLQREMDVDQQAAGIVAKAVAQIATHLHPADTLCPLCSHEYAIGELIEAARLSMSRLKSGNPVTAASLSEANINLGKIEKQLQTALDDSAAAVARIQALEVILQEFAALQLRVTSHDALAGLLPSEIDGFPARRRAMLLESARTIERSLAEEPVADEVEKKQLEAESAIRGWNELIKTLERTLSETRQDKHKQLAILESNRPLVADLPTTPEELEAMRNELLLKAENFRKLQQDAKLLCADIELKSQQRTVEIAKANVEISAHSKEEKSDGAARKQLLDTWTNLALTGIPDPIVWNARVQFLTEMGTLATRGKERVLALAAGLALWDTNEELIRIDQELAQLDAFASSRGWGSAVESLPKQVELAAAATRRAEGAFGHVKSVTKVLKQRADKFSSAALRPLNRRIERFNAVISPFDFKYQVAAKVTTTSTDVRQSMEIMNPEDDTARSYDPNAFLSEGQASALGLSVLFAAATEYPWSRWPALLLDDPLQNTDLIHASAFIDVIRGMILDRGFQVIISTHDMDEADFISRKCQRGGVNVSRTELTGPGPNGVRLRERPLAS